MAAARYAPINAAGGGRGGRGGRPTHRAGRLLAALAVLAVAAAAVTLAVKARRGPAAGAPPPDVLFVGYDAGETLAFLEVLPALPRGLRVALLVTTTAERVAVEALAAGTLDPSRVRLVRAGRDLGVRVDPAGPRTQRLSDDEVRAVLRAVTPARLAVTGAVSDVQLQLARAMRAAPGGPPVVAAYVDAFEWHDGSVFSRFAPHVDAALVATSGDAAGMRRAARRGNATLAAVAVVGNPTTDAWAREARAENRTALRRRLLGPGANLTAPVVAYAGGYGGAAYEASFREFARAAARLGGEYRFLVSLHPKANGSLETAVLREEGALAAGARVVPKSVSTPRVVAAADQVTSRDSTVGVQALFEGRPSVFLERGQGAAANLAVASGLSPLVHNATAYAAALAAQRAAGFVFDTARLREAAGLPEHPTKAFAQWVVSAATAAAGPATT